MMTIIHLQGIGNEHSEDAWLNKEKTMRITVVGCGNGAFATAADLSFQGHEITLYADITHARNFEEILKSGSIACTGRGPQGDISIHRVTCDENEAFRNPELIVISTPAYAHGVIAHRIAPHLSDGDMILLSPGGTGGALCMSEILKKESPARNLKIGEFHTLPYAARKEGGRGVNIILMVKYLLFAAFPSVYSEEMYRIIKPLYPYTVLAADVLETSLNNGNATTHPAPVVLNAGKIEFYGRHYHYAEGITPSVARVVQLIDDERKALCRAFGYEELDIKDRLYKMGYCPRRDTLHECIKESKDVFIPIKGPDRLDDRYLTEDTPAGLVFMSTAADAAGVDTPYMDAIIRLASGLMAEDYLETGRTVRKAGLGDLSVEEIREYLKTGVM